MKTIKLSILRAARLAGLFHLFRYLTRSKVRSCATTEGVSAMSIVSIRCFFVVLTSSMTAYSGSATKAFPFFPWRAGLASSVVTPLAHGYPRY